MADVNQRVTEEWTEETTTFQRVRAVVGRTYEGETARTIAEQAAVAESTARGHLEDLADEGYVEKASDPDNGATLYLRSWESLVFEQAQDIVAHVDSETLLERVREMQAEIREYQEMTGVTAPEDIAWNDVELERETIRKWKTTERNLSFAKVALALDQAEDVVRKPGRA